MQKCKNSNFSSLQSLSFVVAFCFCAISPGVLFAACDYTDADLYNGWGWNPVEMTSCTPLPDNGGSCDFTSADSHMGWGWNPTTQMSCEPLILTAGECVDSDGDGWGWNGVESCVINATTTVTDHLVLVDIGAATAYDYERTLDGALSFFQYWGSDLHSGDSGRYSDVFVKDNNTGVISVLSVGENNTEANNDSYLSGASHDGNTVLLGSRVTNFSGTTANGVEQLYLVDVPTGVITQVASDMPGRSPWSTVNGQLSADGNYVAFSTAAGNIVANDNNNASDVFLLDVANNTTSRITLSPTGEEANDRSYLRDISSDGRYVLFVSDATNLVSETEFSSGLYIYDRLDQSTSLIRRLKGLHEATMSDDGSIVAFQYRRGPTGMALAWINTQTGAQAGIEPLSVGYFSSPQVSPDGRHVAYASENTDLVDNITVSGDRTHLYVTELATDNTTLISRSVNGQEANNSTYSAEFIAGGRFLRFNSNANDLHSQDTDTNDDTFLFEMPAQ